ncbi:MAG: hypothetical protein IIY04_06890 [Oscillospiraceae bacterium]|nr:hypothetical protein [Oscillospiraceae bacterium]
MESYQNSKRLSAPKLTIADEVIAKAWDMALDNLLLINTVQAMPERHNKAGLLDMDFGLMIRAGGGYSQPWTRDAAINTMNAACFLEPEAAKNTLFAVCSRDEDGEVVVQCDNQQWDKIIWVLGAWKYYLATGDRDFLNIAFEVASRTLREREEHAFNREMGLFTGGAVFQDGIAGYPIDLYKQGSDEQFMGEHPLVEGIMSLSVNCVYFAVYNTLTAMAKELSCEADASWQTKASALQRSVQKHLWDEQAGTFSYLLYPDGRTCSAQEGCGISFAILSGICTDEQAKRVLQTCHRGKNGLMAVWPPFEGTSSEERPARHNNLVWPFINGFFTTACAKHGRCDLAGEELRCMARLAVTSGEFYEIYHPETGEPYGGWQCGQFWDSFPNQT